MSTDWEWRLVKLQDGTVEMINVINGHIINGKAHDPRNLLNSVLNGRLSGDTEWARRMLAELDALEDKTETPDEFALTWLDYQEKNSRGVTP